MVNKEPEDRIDREVATDAVHSVRKTSAAASATTTTTTTDQEDTTEDRQEIYRPMSKTVKTA